MDSPDTLDPTAYHRIGGAWDAVDWVFHCWWWIFSAVVPEMGHALPRSSSLPGKGAFLGAGLGPRQEALLAWLPTPNFSETQFRQIPQVAAAALPWPSDSGAAGC